MKESQKVLIYCDYIMRLFVEPGTNFTEEAKYLFAIFAQNKNTRFDLVNRIEDSEISIGSNTTYDFEVSASFYGSLQKGIYQFQNFLDNTCIIKTESNRPDYISTVFYMINSFQEYAARDVDDIGRFQYKDSYQATFGNVELNLVQHCFDKLCEHPKLAHLKNHKSQSCVFLSHDIDSINGALLQDGFHLLKQGKPHLIFNLLLNAILQRPDWLNIEEIMKIEDEHSFKSTFFWLVNKGWLNKKEVNSDYNLTSKIIQSVIGNVKVKGWENELHKSISTDSYGEEIKKTAFQPKANRNHYLKFTLPELYDNIEKSGLLLDASLGFAEAMGFRNSYGLPFTPYNTKERKPYSFVEVPLTIMDRTLHKYMNIPAKETAQTIINFLEKNKSNCVISILWHNNYFTNYKFQGYLDVYKKVLGYLQEAKWSSASTSEIIDQYSMK